MTALSYPHIASQLFDTPLLIAPGKLEAILRVLAPRMGFGVQDGSAAMLPHEQAAADEQGSRSLAAAAQGDSDTRLIRMGMDHVQVSHTEAGYIRMNDVAVLPIMGSLVQRGGYIGYSGMTSYDAIGEMLDAAMADSGAKRLLLLVDSPGGQVAGAFDLADRIYEARSKKPITAVASELAASAGYLLASSASEVVVARTGYVGSIGVVTAHVDYSDAIKEAGIAVTYVYAGDKKVDGNPYERLSKRARADMQDSIDRLYGLFTQTVARNRGLDVDAVVATQAGMYLGDGGVAAGLADRVGDYDGELDRLLTQSQPAAQPRLSQTQKVNTMDEQEKAAAAAQQQVAEQEQKAKAQADSARTAGMQTERERIKGITGHAEAKGRSALAEHLAFSTDMSVEDAAKILAASPKSEGGLAAAMNGKGTSGVVPDGSGGDEAQAAEAEAKIAADLAPGKVFGRLNQALSGKAH